ncbi:MAG: hypothetical protein J2P15_17640 [Micromonosporaceae bacterium]|nr:hypothetical protein [Micromonosporaceae bacterium]
MRTLSGIGATAVLATAALAGCGLLGQQCDATPLSDIAAPDGQRHAVIFEYDCGATTGSATHVSLLDRGRRLPAGPGNTFVADDNHGAVPAGLGGGPQVAATWLSSDRLRLAYPCGARSSTASPEWTVSRWSTPS